MNAELAWRVLRRALEITGSKTLLRARLGVGERSLESWLAAEARIPERIVDEAVNLVLEDDIGRAAQDRRELPRAGRIADELTSER